MCPTYVPVCRIDDVYRKVISAKPEWRSRGLRGRIAKGQSAARDAAMRKLVRQLQMQAGDDNHLWNAPSHVFGEGIAARAGIQMPLPSIPIAQPNVKGCFLHYLPSLC